MAKASEDQFSFVRKLSIILGIILNKRESQSILLKTPENKKPSKKKKKYQNKVLNILITI